MQPGITLETVLLRILVCLLIIFTVLPFHEFAHGYIAYKLGDRTAKNMGRLTINPLAHIDYLGALCIILIGFGWAKPVPIDPRNFKKPKSGMAITAAAGPISNLLAAFIGALCYNVVYCFRFSMQYNLSMALLYFFGFYISINVTLGIFNLIPIPPLDGSKILSIFIPDRIIYKFYQYQQQLSLILFFVVLMIINMPFFDILINSTTKGIVWLAGRPFGLY